MKTAQQFTVAAALLFHGLCLCYADGVNVSDDGGCAQNAKANSGHPVTHSLYMRAMELSNGLVDYKFNYTVCLSSAFHGGREAWALDQRTSGLGMTAPTECNWFPGGFINVFANGDHCGLHKAAWEAREFGSKGRLHGAWQVAGSKIDMDLVLVPNDPWLYIQVRIDPAAAGSQIVLVAYPGGYTQSRLMVSSDGGMCQKAGDRLNVTLARAAESGWWLFCADPSSDFETNPKGQGPCSLLCIPGDVQSVNCGYGYDVAITLAPVASVTRLAVREFPKMSNAGGLEQTRGAASNVTANLLKLFPRE